MRDVETARIVNVADFESIARTTMAAAAFDYVAGGAWDEVTLAENEEAWRRRRLRPRVLVDVSAVDPATTMLGTRVSMPVAVAPMAGHGLAHADAEAATARAAAAAGVPFTLSTMSTRSIEDVSDAAPDSIRWFQLYAQADAGRSRALVERSVASGYGAIVLTVDLPRVGYRERDRRSGFDLPGPHGNFATSIAPTHAAGAHEPRIDEPGYDLLDERLLSKLTWGSLSAIRSWSSLPLVLKGVMTGEDAAIAIDHGVDALVVSNHGARQLDRVSATVDVLQEVVSAVDGRAEVWVDGGVRRGLDVAIALALGAQGVMIGRPLMWALAADGQAGVELALAIVREEFEIALALLGATDPSKITRDHVARERSRTAT
jgi:isopentenyl diphosphate isomerase/L-lactate dehydrogenase-like FMN-dependent dehydrogenase